jgi:hypothetical protein
MHATGKFIIGFSVALVAFLCLNAIVYIAFTTPGYQRIGFPFKAWCHLGHNEHYHIGGLLADIVVALLCSYKAGHWYSLWCWRKANRRAEYGQGS